MFHTWYGLKACVWHIYNINLSSHIIFKGILSMHGQNRCFHPILIACIKYFTNFKINHASPLNRTTIAVQSYFVAFVRWITHPPIRSKIKSLIPPLSSIMQLPSPLMLVSFELGNIRQQTTAHHQPLISNRLYAFQISEKRPSSSLQLLPPLIYMSYVSGVQVLSFLRLWPVVLVSAQRHQ